MDLKVLVEDIVKAIVDETEHVVVREMAGEKTMVLELRVAPDDVGKVIGKKGRTATAIRTLLSAAGKKEGKRYILEVLE